MWHVRRAGCYFIIEVRTRQLSPDGHVGTNLRQKEAFWNPIVCAWRRYEPLLNTIEHDVCLDDTHFSTSFVRIRWEHLPRNESRVEKKKILRAFSYQKEIIVLQRQEKGFVTVIPSVCVLSNISAWITWHETLCYYPFARQAVCQGLFIFFSSQKMLRRVFMGMTTTEII